jgi:hypothetical protein
LHWGGFILITVSCTNDGLGQQKYRPGEWTSTEKRIEVGHLMTKVVVGFLYEGVGRGDALPELMRYHLLRGLLLFFSGM